MDGCTLRVETAAGRRVFPVAVGRLLPDGGERAIGRFQTGSDPHDRRFYLPARREPAFHRGLPFLRLARRAGAKVAASLVGDAEVFGIHGPVTPTLIWGRVSAGCIRMAPRHLRWLYGYAIRHPGLELLVTPDLDQVGGRTVMPSSDRPPQPGCPEARLGVRRLRRAPFGTPQHDRVCGGVDHWWAMELKGGETLRVQLQHAGALRAELFGLRGISEVARGRLGFQHVVPVAPRNRGDRYLRITRDGVADPAGDAQPYTLELSLGP